MAQRSDSNVFTGAEWLDTVSDVDSIISFAIAGWGQPWVLLYCLLSGC